MGILANENAIGGGNYLIERSLRFQSASSQYLSRTPASAGNQKTWTWSGWVKRGALGIRCGLFGAVDTYIQFIASDILEINLRAATTNYIWTTSQVFRDPSAWYHIVLAVDTTQATATDRMKLYVNGSQVTAFASSATIPQNTDTRVNSTALHTIGSYNATTDYLDGYQTEINFINAQQLTPSSFGETDALTGVWVAKRYTGTYGTNGFYLKFNDGTSTTTLGQDRSGNANNWTLTNFTRSAGVSDCWMLDVPSGNGSPSATQPSSNYAVLNPLWKGSLITVSNANQTITSTSAGLTLQQSPSTIGMNGGKFYWEVNVTTAASPTATLGVALPTASPNSGIGRDANSWGYNPNGSGASVIWYNNTGTNVAQDANTGTFGVAFDADSGKLWFRNSAGNWISGDPAAGTSPSFTGVTAGVLPTIGQSTGGGTTVVSHLNCGQRSFAYTPPSGFKALCTANLPAPTIAKGNQYMDATLYTGNGSARSITNDGSFSPDLVWIKGRSGATDHALYDAVRGTTLDLVSNSTAAETTQAQGVTAFNSNGFSIGTLAKLNTNTATYVAWQWDAGSSTVTNTSGTISSQVRANTTAGFSIVTYTAQTSGSATVGHGLGVAPKMIITKRRSTANNWITWHTALTSTEYILLNTTAAKVTGATTFWNSTLPTSTVFSLGSAFAAASDTYVAYCFAEIAGFSKFGSYTGNGSADGVFVYTGFRPKFVMIKRTDGIGSWFMIDTSRAPSNVVNPYLMANSSNAEATDLSWDILSNGFKLRSSYADINASNGTFIYAAFAENPFNYSNAR